MTVFCSNYCSSSKGFDPLLDHISNCRWNESLDIFLQASYDMGKLAATSCDYCGVTPVTCCYVKNAPDELMITIVNHMLKWTTDEWSIYCADMFRCSHHEEQTVESILVIAVCYKFPDDVIDKMFSFYRNQKSCYNSNREQIMGSILINNINQMESDRKAIDLLLTYPKCARLIHDGKTMLQRAIELKYNRIIPFLTNACPEPALQISDFKSPSDSVDLVGATPLAMTIALMMPTETVLAVFKVYPYAATVMINVRSQSGDTRHYYPFHMAIINSLSEEIVNALLQEILLNAKILRGTEQKRTLIYSLEENLPDIHLLQILKADEEAASLKYGRSEEVILHHVMQARKSDDVILAVLFAYKDAAKVLDSNYILPLHYALKHVFSDQVVIELFKCNKEAATCPITKSHLMPYQFALIKGYPRSSIVQLLLEPVIELSANLRIEKQVFIVHDLLMSDSKASFIKRALEFDPDSAGIKLSEGLWDVARKVTNTPTDESKRLVQDVMPLHIAIVKRYPVDLVFTIFEHHPTAAVQLVLLDPSKDEPCVKSNSFFTFQLAKMYGYSDTLVSILFDRLKLEAKSISESNQGSISPLHHLINTKSEDNFVLEIIVADTSAVKSPYLDNGDLPLHRALRNEFSENVLLKLIEVYLHSAAIRNRSDLRLPIHEAALRSTSPKVIKSLLLIYPQGLKSKDKNGFYPSDLVQSKLPEESIERVCQLQSGKYITDKLQGLFSFCDTESREALVLNADPESIANSEGDSDS